MLPGGYLKTFTYLNLIERPRTVLRLALNTFYSLDHIYAVVKEFGGHYEGEFSGLDFGTSGFAFTKILYANQVPCGGRSHPGSRFRLL